MKDLEHWNVQCLSALWGYSRLFSLNIAPQRPVKCFDNLVKKFDFNLNISNPKGSSNVEFSVTLETCTVSQKARTMQKTAETLVRACSIKQNCKEHVPYGILHIPQFHVHPSVILMLWLSAQPEKRINL